MLWESTGSVTNRKTLDEIKEAVVKRYPLARFERLGLDHYNVYTNPLFMREKKRVGVITKQVRKVWAKGKGHVKKEEEINE